MGTPVSRLLVGTVPVLALALAAWQAVEIHQLRDQVAELQSERQTVVITPASVEPKGEVHEWEYGDPSFRLVGRHQP